MLPPNTGFLDKPCGRVDPDSTFWIRYLEGMMPQITKILVKVSIIGLVHPKMKIS